MRRAARIAGRRITAGLEQSQSYSSDELDDHSSQASDESAKHSDYEGEGTKGSRSAYSQSGILAEDEIEHGDDENDAQDDDDEVQQDDRDQDCNIAENLLDDEDRRFLALVREQERPKPIMSDTRVSSFTPSRQTVRNGIVQQWSPNTTHTNGTSNVPTTGQAPLTPPTNAEDEAELKRRHLEHEIQMQVEENGIERPKGYTVSFHYNRSVENMHFGRTHPMKPWRLTLTKHLVMGYGLQFAMDNYEALPASAEAVAEFHDPEYVDFLSKCAFPPLRRM